MLEIKLNKLSKKILKKIKQRNAARKTSIVEEIKKSI